MNAITLSPYILIPMGMDLIMLSFLWRTQFIPPFRSSVQRAYWLILIMSLQKNPICQVRVH